MSGHFSNKEIVMEHQWGPRISKDASDQLNALVTKVIGSRIPRQQELFDELFRDQVAPNGCLPDGEPILKYALRSKCKPFVMSLLNQASVQPMISRFSLAYFVWSSAIVEKLLELGFPVREQTTENSYVTIQAVQSDDPKVIRLLSKYGLHLDRSTVGGAPVLPLCIAASAQNYANVIALLKAGSNPLNFDDEGDTFLHKLLKNRSDRPDPFLDDHADEFRKVVKYCVQKGISLDVVNNDGQTAMHVAAKYGYVNSLVALLEYGATADLKDLKKRTALAIAKKKGHLEVAQALGAHLARERIMDVVKASRPSPAG